MSESILICILFMFAAVVWQVVEGIKSQMMFKTLDKMWSNLQTQIDTLTRELEEVKRKLEK